MDLWKSMPFEIIKYWFQGDSIDFNGNSIQKKNVYYLQIGGNNGSTGCMILKQIYHKKDPLSAPRIWALWLYHEEFFVSIVSILAYQRFMPETISMSHDSASIGGNRQQRMRCQQTLWQRIKLMTIHHWPRFLIIDHSQWWLQNRML